MSFTDFNVMWVCTLDNLRQDGDFLESRVGGSTELLGYAETLSDPTRSLLTVPGRKLSIEYACAELLWYLNESDSGEIIMAYAPKNYGQFLTADGRADGHYGQRWHSCESFRRRNQTRHKSALDYVIKTLKEQPESRQCVLSMWQSGDLVTGYDKASKDIPCTLSLQFLQRYGCLSMIATMRSNDVWLGMPYDVYCFTAIQKIVASCIGASLGRYYHRAGSMHQYDRNATAIRAIQVDTGNIPAYQPVSYVESSFDYREHLKIALDFEFTARVLQRPSLLEKKLDDLDRVHYVLRDAALVCANKWVPEMKLREDCLQENHRVDIGRS